MENKFQKGVIYTNQAPDFVKMIENHPMPVPDKKHLIVEVHSVSLNAGDYRIQEIFGVFAKNKLICQDFAGKVTYVPPNIQKFKVGDEVFGQKFYGCLAEYIQVTPDECALKPPQVSYDDICTLPIPGCTSLQALRDYGKIQQGNEVLIIGASGGCGCLGIQIAKALGAKSVTAVCSAKNFEFVKKCGADFVHDYNSQEGSLPKNQKFDLIYNTVSCFDGIDYYPEAFKLLKNKNSLYVTIGGSMGDIFRAGIASMFGNWAQRDQFRNVTQGKSLLDLQFLAQQTADGKIKSVIQSQFSFTPQDVVKAYLLIKSKKTVGKSIIKLK